MLFSGYIVGYLFLAGAGSGAFFVSACCCIGDAVWKTEGSERLVRSTQMGFCVAPCLVLLASLLLLLDLGNAERVWLVATMPFQSVMSAGAWFVALFTLVSGGLAVAALLVREVPRALLWACCVVGLLLAAGTMGYTGVLLADMVGIDFWRTPWLVALFVASSLSCGVAAITVLDVALLPPTRAAAPSLWRVACVLTCIEACVLAAFMAVQHGYTETARASCDLLLSGRLSAAFWGGVCAAGLAVPLAAHAVAGRLVPAPAAHLVASAGVLVGGLLLRYCVIAAALYTPLALSAL